MLSVNAYSECKCAAYDKTNFDACLIMWCNPISYKMGYKCSDWAYRRKSFGGSEKVCLQWKKPNCDPQKECTEMFAKHKKTCMRGKK